MPGKVNHLDNIQGLSQVQVASLQRQYGKNSLQSTDNNHFWRVLAGIVLEPMFLLLVIACALYFVLGNIAEGIMMAVAMTIVSAISFYQELKSSRALESLEQLTEPRVTVIRDGKEHQVMSSELVLGDIMLLEEGMKIPADALLLQGNDLSVNESILTGESLPVEKNETGDHTLLYQGTTIESGKSIARVTATGNNTELGKIGKSIAGYSRSKTLLQVQVNSFVKRLALFGLAAFFIILIVNYYHYREFVTSLLFALTLAMSVVPEEIPVAFSSFMALGAYKMSKLGVLSRQPQVIENLGAVTVICLDKTGTITENKMQVKSIYDHRKEMVIDRDEMTPGFGENKYVLIYAVLASESDPFDPMEKAILEAYPSQPGDEKLKMIYEYPLEGKPPMMTHVYQSTNDIIVAAKGAPERILAVCNLDNETKTKINRLIQDSAGKGYRVLGVASAVHPGGPFPASQNDFAWQFEGLVALYDPPKENMADVLRNLQEAKIQVKLLTGDYAETAINIAKQVGISNALRFHSGKEVMDMDETSLRAAVKDTNIFARMFPEAKLKVINALKANGEIVAMTGDGVNDGPALKASDIGIAMGKKGTETARQASDLVLTDDNMEKMVTAIKEGRRIYSNLLKAVRYIISIHIPIILTASLPLVLGWKYPNIFTPVHVIFLELIMGPTCSIFFEREPVEENSMHSPPRRNNTGLFTKGQLIISVIQGLAITAGVLILYHISMTNGNPIEETRMIVFTTLILSNVFLTFANRSFSRTIYYTSRYKNGLVPVILVASVGLLFLLHRVPPIRGFFQLAPIGSFEFGLCLAVAFAVVMWFEIYKASLRKIM